MQYVLPNDLSNVKVHMPIRAQTMLVNGYPVQSVAQFDYSANRVTLDQMYVYDPSNAGVDPYYLDPSGAMTQGASRNINKIYKDMAKDMKAAPIFHSNKYALNLYNI
jgi:hypothetical protein